MPTLWDQPFTQQQQQATGTPGGSNMFYQPQSGYGADRNWNDTPLTGIIREQNPQLAYAQYGQNMGVADQDTAFSRWFYQQFPRFQNAYGLATLDNPMITMDRFLSTLPGMQSIQNQYQSLSPTARGLNFNSMAPTARWIGR